MKPRGMILGGGAVAVLVAGGILSRFLPSLGIGNGADNNVPALVEENQELKAPPADDPAVEVEDDSFPDLAEADRDKVLQVRIDGRDFLLWPADSTSRNLQKVDLPAVVEAARIYPGNQDGIRVRVSRSKTSKASVELQLRNELGKAGIAADQIEWLNGPPPLD